MTALDSGQFVIAHLNDFGEDATADTLIVVEADVFKADGSSSNIHFISTNEQRIHATWPTLAPLSGARFLMGWVQFNVDNLPATTNVKARVFSTQGPVGQITQFNTSTGNNRFSLSAATLSGPQGEIAFAAWADDSQSGGDTAGRAVRGRPLSVPGSRVLVPLHSDFDWLSRLSLMSGGRSASGRTIAQSPHRRGMRHAVVRSGGGAGGLRGAAFSGRRPPLPFCHRHVRFDRVGNETILMSSVMHLIEFFCTGSSVAAPCDLRA